MVIISDGGILVIIAETARIRLPDMIIVFLLPPSYHFFGVFPPLRFTLDSEVSSKEMKKGQFTFDLFSTVL